MTNYSICQYVLLRACVSDVTGVRSRDACPFAGDDVSDGFCGNQSFKSNEEAGGRGGWWGSGQGEGPEGGCVLLKIESLNLDLVGKNENGVNNNPPPPLPPPLYHGAPFSLSVTSRHVT